MAVDGVRGYTWKKIGRKKDRELEPERWTEEDIERREEPDTDRGGEMEEAAM